jgi:glycosyltransferase involved in cell wall biosynthesis
VSRRILFIGNNVSALFRFRASLVHAMLTSGLHVDLLMPDDESVFGDFDAEVSAFRAMGAGVHVFPMRRARITPFGDLRAAFHMMLCIVRQKPDTVITYMMKPVVYGTLVAWLLGVKHRYAMLDGLGFAFTDRGDERVTIAARFVRFMLKKALRRAHSVLFLNHDDGNELRGLDILTKVTPSHVINGTGLDLAYFDGPKVSLKSKKFVLIARMLMDKGIREFAEAAKLVKVAHPDAEFVLIGGIDDAEGAISKEEIERWTWMTYEGKLSDVRIAIRDCLAYVLPSYREGRPRTVMEAMAMRRACIVTDVPGCRECITDGETGKIVPARDAIALAKAMISYLEQPELAMRHGEAARLVAHKLYRDDVVNASVIDVLCLESPVR